MKFSFFLPMVCFFFSCKSQDTVKMEPNKDDNSLLWEISGNGLKQPSYLFGTFHLMCKEDIHFSDNLHKAIQASSEVYFEMDLDDPQNSLGAIFLMNMKDGKSLKDLYTAEEYQRLERYFNDSLSMPLMALEKMKPLFLEALMYPKMLACENMSGVEQELMQIAKKEKKPIGGFETIAFQASVFDSIPYKVQAQSLLKTIDSIHQYQDYFEEMLEVYKSQQLDRIEALFNKSEFGSIENLDILLDNRNENWVNQLKTILPEKNIFMAVGAAHLVGKKGLIALLKKEGFEVRAMKN